MTRPGETPDLHGRPTATELVEAVREFLERDVMTVADKRVAYHARVAANVLAMVERELADAGRSERSHVERLEALGFADDEALSAAIRSGSLDDRWDEVVAAVAADVTRKVAIANPTYTDGRTGPT